MILLAKTQNFKIGKSICTLCSK